MPMPTTNLTPIFSAQKLYKHTHTHTDIEVYKVYIQIYTRNENARYNLKTTKATPIQFKQIQK